MAIPYSFSEWAKMGQFVSLDDGKVFYVHKGEGFPVILMHFYGGNSWFFSRVIDTLAEHFSVYAMDLPGCAESEEPPLPYGPPEYADALQEFMNKLGIQKAHLVGGHGSSLTTAHFATTRPSRVAKIVMDGTPPWNRLEGKKWFAEWMRPMWLDEDELPTPHEQQGGPTDAAERRPGLLANSFSSITNDDEVRKLAVQRASTDFEEHGKWWVAILKEALKYDVYARLDLIHAPTLVVNGENEWGRRSEYRLLNGIVGSRLAVIEGSGGNPAFERPVAWSEVVLPFLIGVGD